MKGEGGIKQNYTPVYKGEGVYTSKYVHEIKILSTVFRGFTLRDYGCTINSTGEQSGGGGGGGTIKNGFYNTTYEKRQST